MENGKNSTPRKFETPQPIQKKYETGDGVHENSLCKISCKSVHRGLLGKRVKYNKKFLFP